MLTEFQLLLAAWYDPVFVRSAAGPATVTRDGHQITVRVCRAVAHERLVFRVERVRLGQPDATFRFWSPIQPAEVRIDPHRWLPARINPVTP